MEDSKDIILYGVVKFQCLCKSFRGRMLEAFCRAVNDCVDTFKYMNHVFLHIFSALQWYLTNRRYVLGAQ